MFLPLETAVWPCYVASLFYLGYGDLWWPHSAVWVMETSGGLFQKAAVGPSYCPEQGPHASKRGKAAASAHLGRASLTPTEGWVSLIQALGETGPPGYLRPLQSEMETSKAPWPLGAPTGVQTYGSLCSCPLSQSTVPSCSQSTSGFLDRRGQDAEGAGST